MKKFYVFIAMFIALFLPLAYACGDSGGSNSKYYSLNLEFNNLSLFSNTFQLNEAEGVFENSDYVYSVSFDGDNYLYLTSNVNLNENIKSNSQIKLSFYLASFVDQSSINLKLNSVNANISFDKVEDYLFFNFSFKLDSNSTISLEGNFELLI